MKTFFLTFALLLTGASVFASDSAVEQVDGNLTEVVMADTDIMADVLDDEICYTVTVSAQGTIGPVSVGGGITISGCGNTASAAWADLQQALRHFHQQ